MKPTTNEARLLDLVILDDIFPSLTSGFRLHEYHELIRKYPHTRILSNSPDISKDMWEYQNQYPGQAARVRPFSDAPRYRARAAFVLFLNNAFTFVNYLETQRIPFMLSLNPGGGFHLGEAESDAKLARVFASPMFRHVLVTQKVSLEYVAKKNLCPKERVTFHFGGVVPPFSPQHVQHFPKDKPHCDVCFVAAKYDPLGRDKGYDIYTNLVHLFRGDSRLRFHVVGGFGPRDYAMPEESSVTFYGHIKNKDFPEFYRKMDFIVSPNRPAMLYKGSFDGFPTACCVEAALCGVIPIVTDPLALKPMWWKPECVPIVPPSAPHIAQRIEAFLSDPVMLARSRHITLHTLARCFGLNAQMKTRHRIIDSIQVQAQTQRAGAGP